jgi:aspartate-semialdehyde dehydrogenase
MARSASVAIIGATGTVGRHLVEVLEQRQFPLSNLALYASPRTAGEVMSCGALTARVELLDTARFVDVDIALMAAGEQVSAEWVGRAVEDGALVVDLSQLFIDEPEVPVVVPEINAVALEGIRDRSIISSPDAVAIGAALVLHPLHQAAQIRRLVLTSFEPASGAGRAGVDELQQQTIDLMSGQGCETAVFPRRIAFNLIPQLGDILAGGSTRAEAVATAAIRRLLGEDIPTSMTRVYVPTFYGLGLAINVETTQPMEADEAHAALSTAPGLLLSEAVEVGSYPTPADTVGEDVTCVGRIRSQSELNVIDLWATLDNSRKGSAVNAVQIAEILLREHL